MELVARKLHIGKHVSFNAEVTIHDLTNVPLVTGKFSCKWRFKNHISAQSAAVGDASSSSGTTFLHPRSALHISRRARDSDSSDDDSSSRQSGSRRNSVSSDRLKRPDLDLNRPGRSASSATARPGTSEQPSKPEPRGHTESVPLSKHTANWQDRCIICPVSMSVAKDGELGPCPLKMVIRQTFHNEHGKTEEARLGDVEADLADFADPQRSSTRRYLLNNSRINALLRITVKLQYVSGVRDYHAPPRGRNHLKETMKKKAGASSESLNSKGSRQNSKNSKDSREKTSPASSLHSKRSGGSSGPPPPRSPKGANGSHRSSSGSAAPFSPTLALSSLTSSLGQRSGAHSHHNPEALIEHLFSTTLADLPPPAELKKDVKPDTVIYDEPDALSVDTKSQAESQHSGPLNGAAHFFHRHGHPRRDTSSTQSSRSHSNSVSRPHEALIRAH